VRLTETRPRIGAVARATHASAAFAGKDRRRESSLERSLGRTTRLLHDALAAAHDAC
jgi:hypothetical protein